MCTRPDYHSVPGSARAFGQAVLTAMFSIGVLLMAVVYAPIGFARNHTQGNFALPRLHTLMCRYTSRKRSVSPN